MPLYRKTFVEVNLDAIARNTRAFCALTSGAAVMAIVKANAYGHGMCRVAGAALDAGATWLGVAIQEEGQTLRQSGVTAPILVLGGADADGAEASVRCGLTQTVFTARGVFDLENACLRLGKPCDVHIKLDTGMGRIGVRSREELQSVLSALDACPHVRLTGAFTHFADADGEDYLPYSERQLNAFLQWTALLPKGIVLHASATAAALRLPNARFDMVRQGIALYGYPPVQTDAAFERALSWKTRIGYIKRVSRGDCISYGCVYRAPDSRLIATLPVGYGDGYHRACSGKAQVLVGGRRVPVVGRICMDQMMADVTDVPNAREGDEVVLLGEQGNETITAEDIAAWAGTICYEVLLAITPRVPVVYTHDFQKGTDV